MPMFDNPKKELQRLQEQLLWEEEEEELEQMEDEEDFEFSELFEDEEEYPQNRHTGSGYRKKSIFDEIEDAFEDEDDEEPFALFVEERRGFFGRKKRPSTGKGSNRGLQITILLEIIAILGILIWWVVMRL